MIGKLDRKVGARDGVAIGDTVVAYVIGLIPSVDAEDDGTLLGGPGTLEADVWLITSRSTARQEHADADGEQGPQFLDFHELTESGFVVADVKGDDKGHLCYWY